MIAYCASTSTKKTLSALRASGWRLMLTPDILKKTKGNHPQLWPTGEAAPYALDNGAFGAFNRGAPFDSDSFRWAVARAGAGADWIAIPDSVGNAAATYKLAGEWVEFVKKHTRRPLFVVQDDMETKDVQRWVARGCGLFVGGSTHFKLNTMEKWASLAHDHGKRCHVGRVNSQKRIMLCAHAGADSFDGSSVAQFPSTLATLQRAVQFVNNQRSMF